jgi:spore germination protein
MGELQRTWRRWPFERRRERGPVPETVSMLDSISLTAFYTVPAPPETTPSPNADDVFASLWSDGSVDPELFRSGEHPAVDWGHTLEWGRRPLRKVALGVGGLALLGGGLVAGLGATTSATTAPPAHVRVADSPVDDHLIDQASPANLASASAAPGPALPMVALAPPTSAHEVFGYAPYWSLPQASQFPVKDFSTIAYFSVDVNPNGSIQMSGPGWEGYESQDLTDLVNEAHISGDRVVLTVTDFSQSSLDTLTHDPNAGNTLGVQLAELVREKNLDGVNLDFEGTGNGDQAGLDHLVSQVDFDLHTTDPHYQLTMATYASSAGDPDGFYDISGLSKWVDAFFVMAYDVDQGSTQGDGNAGDADATYMAQYVAAAGASKVIWGLPLFGYDEPTNGPDLGDPATGPSQAVTYAQAMASGTTYWNAATQTAWTSYQAGTQWHQVFFDNANTLSAKVQLAAGSHLLGVGAWALGMEGDDDSILSVLDGGTAPLRTPPTGPAATSATGQPSITNELSGNGGTVQTGTPSAASGHTGGSADVTTTTRTKGVKGSKGTTTTSSSTTTSTSTTTTTTSPSRSTTTTDDTGGTGTGGASTTTTSSS